MARKRSHYRMVTFISKSRPTAAAAAALSEKFARTARVNANPLTNFRCGCDLVHSTVKLRSRPDNFAREESRVRVTCLEIIVFSVSCTDATARIMSRMIYSSSPTAAGRLVFLLRKTTLGVVVSSILKTLKKKILTLLRRNCE